MLSATGTASTGCRRTAWREAARLLRSRKPTRLVALGTARSRGLLFSPRRYPTVTLLPSGSGQDSAPSDRPRFAAMRVFSGRFQSRASRRAGGCGGGRQRRRQDEGGGHAVLHCRRAARPPESFNPPSSHAPGAAHEPGQHSPNGRAARPVGRELRRSHATDPGCRRAEALLAPAPRAEGRAEGRKSSAAVKEPANEVKLLPTVRAVEDSCTAELPTTPSRAARRFRRAGAVRQVPEQPDRAASRCPARRSPSRWPTRPSW